MGTLVFGRGGPATPDQILPAEFIGSHVAHLMVVVNWPNRYNLEAEGN
jgi:hypothetical protein